MDNDLRINRKKGTYLQFEATFLFLYIKYNKQIKNRLEANSEPLKPFSNNLSLETSKILVIRLSFIILFF